MGADRIFMKSGALIGDVGVLDMNDTGQFIYVEAKLASVVATAFAGLAAKQGRPTALVEAMVFRKLQVIEARELKTGKRCFLKKTEKGFAEDLTQYDVIGPVAETLEDRFLTLGSQARNGARNR